jgi:hypothetical protein
LRTTKARRSSANGVSSTPVGGTQHQLPEARHHRQRGAAHAGALGVDRQVAPGQREQALLGRDGVDAGAHGRRLLLVGGEEGGADGVAPALGQRDAGVGEHGAQQRVRHLGEHAGAVTRLRLGAGGTAVLEVAQRRQALLDDAVAGPAGDVDDEGDAARVVLVRGVVQALPRRQAGAGGEGAGQGHAVPPSGGGTVVLVCSPGTSAALLQMSARLQQPPPISRQPCPDCP